MIPFLIVLSVAAVCIPMYWRLYEKPEAAFFTIIALVALGYSAIDFLT